MGSIFLPAPAAPCFNLPSSSSASPTAIRARDWQRLSQTLMYLPDTLEDIHLGVSQMSQSSTESMDVPIPRALLRPDNLGPLLCSSGSQTAKAREIARMDGSLRRRMQAGAALTKLHPQSPDYSNDFTRPASLSKQKQTSLGRHLSEASQVPQEGVILPTHILALRIGPQDPRWTYIPIHWQTLAAFCNRPPSSLFDPAANNVPLNTVPLVEGTMPFPQGFQVLRDYFYTRSLASLLSALLPAELEKVQTPSVSQYCSASQTCTRQRRRSAPEALESLARAIASTYSPLEIVNRTKWIYGVYLNAWCLLVNDNDVWTALAMTWSVIVRALDLRLDHYSSCCR